MRGKRIAGVDHMLPLAVGSPAWLDCTGFSAGGSFTSGEKSLTLTSIIYTGCVVHSLLSLTATVNMNGCDYRLEGLTGGGSPNALESMAIKCPEGKEVVVTVAVGGCQLKIPPQTATGTATVTDNAGPPKTLTANLQFTSITFSSTGTASACGPAGTYEKGVLEGNFVVKGFSDEAHKTATGIFVS